MKSAYTARFGAAMMSFVFAVMSLASKEGANIEGASPICGVTIPRGYRQCELIAPAQEADPLNELRATLGNPVAIDAYRKGTFPSRMEPFLQSSPGSMFSPLNLNPLSSPVRPPQSKSWSKTRKSTVPRAFGGSADLLTANQSTRRSTKPALLATKIE
jgi:hypothetical protein